MSFNPVGPHSQFFQGEIKQQQEADQKEGSRISEVATSVLPNPHSVTPQVSQSLSDRSARVLNEFDNLPEAILKEDEVLIRSVEELVLEQDLSKAVDVLAIGYDVDKAIEIANASQNKDDALRAVITCFQVRYKELRNRELIDKMVEIALTMSNVEKRDESLREIVSFLLLTVSQYSIRKSEEIINKISSTFIKIRALTAVTQVLINMRFGGGG